MNTNSASKKAISMVCLIAGIILLAAALIQDISGSGAGWRGPALIISVVIYICSNSYYSIMPWCILFLYRLEWNQDDRIYRICKL